MIRVLIVDDSAVVRKVLSEELAKFEGIEVVGTAIDPYSARDKIIQLSPDVITLDVEMPRMDGLSFLGQLMKHYPLPVVIVSSLTPKNSEAAIRALELGAVDVVCKPGSQYSVPDVAKQLVRAIRVAAATNVKKRVEVKSVGEVPARTVKLSQLQTTHRIVAIGASTGGTTAIETVLRNLPAASPGIVIVQHMPEQFTAAFAARLNQLCQIEVREAREGEMVAPGVALIAPGNLHMTLQPSGARFSVRLKEGPLVHFQRPAVDVLFQSVARHVGRNAVGVLLTGMGADGAAGLLAIRKAGAHTIVQDEQTCVVFGMPKEAIKLGAAEHILPLQRVADAILDLVEDKAVAAS